MGMPELEDRIEAQDTAPTQKRSHNRYIFYLLVLCTTLAIYMVIQLQPDILGIHSNQLPDNRHQVLPKNPAPKKQIPDNGAEISEAEPDQWDKEIEETIERLNREAALRRKIPTKKLPIKIKLSGTVEIKEKPVRTQKKKPVQVTKPYIDPLHKCRYAFSIKHQNRGRVDLLVTDSYSGEIRIKRNYTGNDSIRLFKQKTSTTKQRRFFHLVTQQVKGGHDIFVQDSFTGEIKGVKGFTNQNRLSLYDVAMKKASGFYRYFANIQYRDGMIDYFVIDSISSEVRMKRRTIDVTNVSLFEASGDDKAANRRYDFWFENRLEFLDLYVIDTHTSAIRLHPNLKGSIPIRLYKKQSLSGGHPRYQAWFERIDHFMVLFVFDAYQCRLRKFKNQITDPDKGVFRDPPDPKAWMRFTSRIGFWNGNIEIYAFDTVTGTFKIHSCRDFDEVHLFRKEDPQTAEASRFDISILNRVYDNTLEIFILDRYSSEVRRSVIGDNKKVYRLF